MTNPDRVTRSRLGGVAVLIVAGVTAVAAVIVGVRWWGSSGDANATQPMELRGEWLGIRFADTQSASAQQLGVPPSVKGVVVAEISQQAGSRAAQAGIVPGDVVTRVDGTEVSDLRDLYALTTDLNVARPLVVDILRRGQPAALLLPAVPEMSFQPAGAFAAQPATGQAAPAQWGAPPAPPAPGWR